MRIESPAPRRRAPSLTPLIDVVFILLVFFMLVSSFAQWRTVSVDTPAAVVAAAPSEEPDTLRLLVRNNGVLELEGERVSLEQLRRRLQRREQAVVHVVPAEGLTLQPLVSALDTITGAGAEARLIER